MSRMFAPTCCDTLMLAASRPFPVMRPVRSGAPGKTSRCPAPAARHPAGPRPASARCRSIDGHRPGCEHELLHAAGRRSARPARAGWRPSAAPATSCTVRPAASRRAGSATTSISRVSLALTFHLAGARDARQPRPHHIERVIVQVGGETGAGEIEDVHRKRRRSQPFDDRDPCPPAATAARRRSSPAPAAARRSCRSRLELRGDLGRAAERRRPHAADARHFHDRLLERPRHRQHHGARGQRAAMADDDDAREFQAWIDAARESPALPPARRPPARATASRIARPYRSTRPARLMIRSSPRRHRAARSDRGRSPGRPP